MTDPPVPPPVPLTHRFLVDERFAGRVARVLVQRSWLAGRQLAVTILIVVVAVVVSLAADGSERWFAVVLVALLLVGAGVQFVAARADLRRRLPAGAVLRSGFDGARFAVAGPAGGRVLPIAAYDRVLETGDLVLLRMREGRAWTVLPGELVPVEVRAAIIASGGVP